LSAHNAFCAIFMKKIARTRCEHPQMHRMGFGEDILPQPVLDVQ